MSVNYRTSLKTTRLNAVVADIGSTGVLEICTAGYAAILARLTLNATPGTVVDDVLTFSGFPKVGTGLANGNAAVARIRTGVGGADVVTGLTVATSGADVTLDNVTISSGQSVQINSATITHAA